MEVRAGGIGLYLHLSLQLPYDLLFPRDELRSAMLLLFNSGFLLSFQVWNILQSRMYTPSALRSGSVDPPFSLCIVLATWASWRHMFDNHPIVWKREMQVQLPIKSSYLLNQSQTSLSPSLISELLKQRDCALLTLYPQLRHSAWFIVVAQLIMGNCTISKSSSTEFIQSRDVRWNLIMCLSSSMYTRACQLLSPST